VAVLLAEVADAGSAHLEDAQPSRPSIATGRRSRTRWATSGR
jgi:hypothetical protein